MTKYNDEIEYFWEDIKAQNFFDDIKINELVEYFKTLKPIFKRYYDFSRMQSTLQSGLPSLSSSEVSIAVKPVFKKPYDYNEDDIVKYKPEIIGYAPVVLIQLEKTDSFDAFSFQIEPEEFNRLISNLISHQLELKEAEKTCDLLSDINKKG